MLQIHDLARSVMTPLVAGGMPLWTPDGQRIVFTSFVGGEPGLFSISADGSGEAELLVATPGQPAAGSWTPDGRHLAYMVQNDRGEDIWVLSIEEGSAEPFLDSPNREFNPAFSSDGQWLAYVSDDSGRDEVYLQRYPSGAGRLAVTQGGAVNPVWSRDGSELFFTTDAGVVVVTVSTEPEVVIGSPQLLFAHGDPGQDGDTSVASVSYGGPGDLVNFGWAYDVAPEGDRLLMVQQAENPRLANEVIVVQNWTEELKRLAPVD